MMRAPGGAKPALLAAISKHLQIPAPVRAAIIEQVVDDLGAAGFRLARLPPTGRPVGRPRKPGRCVEHLAWIRGLPCSVPDCAGGALRCEAAHVRQGTGGGTGMKPADKWAVPLCRDHHREQHQIGHRAFDEKYGVSLRSFAEDLSALSPYSHLIASSDPSAKAR